MVTARTIGRCISAAMLVVAGIAVCMASAPSVHAASALQTLVARAEQHTNTVRTLIHHDRVTITAATTSVNVPAHGTEDEVRNREQDYESVQVTQRAPNGKINKLSYSIDLIFLNGS